MKKTIHIAISFFFVICLSPNSYSQEWIRTFSNSTYNMVGYQVLEDYDHGILIGGDQSLTTNAKIGLVIKNDINGNVLWEKRLGTGIRKWALLGFENVLDGGIIVAGVCDTLDPEWWDPYIVKLSSCGEVGGAIYSIPTTTLIMVLKSNPCLIKTIFSW